MTRTVLRCLRFCLALALFPLALFPAAGSPAAPSGKYTASEEAALAASRSEASATPLKSLDARLKVYDAAFGRLADEVRNCFRDGGFDALPGALDRLSELLDESLADVEAVEAAVRSSGGGKGGAGKSRRFIRYEIRLRQALKDFQALRAKAPADRRDAFLDFLERTEATRQKFMDILFDQGRPGVKRGLP